MWSCFFPVDVDPDEVDGAPANSYWPWKGCQMTGVWGKDQSAGGFPPNAPTMKRRQIVAGKVPPATVMPWTDVIGIFAFG